MAFVLSPNNGTLYSGSLTFAASEPVQIVILHQIEKPDAKGQPTWTVDGNTIFAETVRRSCTNSGSMLSQVQQLVCILQILQQLLQQSALMVGYEDKHLKQCNTLRESTVTENVTEIIKCKRSCKNPITPWIL